MGKKKKTGFSQFDRMKDEDHDENILKDHQIKIIPTEHGDSPELVDDVEEESIFFDDEENLDQPD